MMEQTGKVILTDILSDCPPNIVIQDALGKCHSVISTHDNIVVSISGGRDSDIVADLVVRCGGKDKSTFVFFNTGLEYEATKRQLKYLENKYGIQIIIVKPIKPIPMCVQEYGVPFWSKYVSEMISRLQKHNFQWEDEPLEVLLNKYPNCRSALRWWCNDFGNGRSFSRFDIRWVNGLKEFLIDNPPKFKISSKCCHYAKKEPARKFWDGADCDLDCIGVRKAEGGNRATSYGNSCYSQMACGPDRYRPIFWFSKEDRNEYDRYFKLSHSDCYEVWGMERTGCAGCPFGKNFEEELKLAKEYEPKFYAAALKVFGESYDYTRRFLEFREQMEGQLCFDLNYGQTIKQERIEILGGAE